MKELKKYSVLIVVVLIVVIIGFVFLSIANTKRHYSLADLGIASLVKTDCSSVKNTNTVSSANISFNVPDVASMRDKTKILITKYGGHISSDSFNSYPSQDPATPSQEDANIVVSFDKSQNEFLAELSSAVKNSGGADSNYSYSDGSQPQDYSSYSSCTDMMQAVSADALQLEVLTKALKEERSPANISFLSQSITNMKSSLQSDVSNMNNFFATADKPSIGISFGTLQK